LTLIGAGAVIWYAVFYFESRQNLLVTFFDVGQGDAILVETPSGQEILIDGGPGNLILPKLGQTLPFWDRSIDLLILTHPHTDHIAGALEVLKRYKVDSVIESGVNHSIPEYEEWKKVLQEKKTKVVSARAGQKVIFSANGTIEILSPLEDFSGKSPKNVHDGMIVSRLRYASTSVLLMGDAEKPIEYQLVRSQNSLRSDILKIGHHGSKTSTTEEFLREVSPKFAVIQVGRKNRYGHPAQEVLDRLAAVGAKVLRNDLEGGIYFKSDGKTIWTEN